LGALRGLITPELLERALRSEGVCAKRIRKLPPDLVACLAVAMALFRTLAIENVLRRIVDGFEGFQRFGFAELPCATSIAHARDRLGWKPLRALFESLVSTLLPKHADMCAWHGFQVFALDGMCCRMPDTKANEAHFGRPGTTRGGKAGFPQLRSLLLVSAWTHVVARAVVGPFRTGELTLAEQLLPAIDASWLILMDRGFYAYAWLASLVSRRQPFVVRVKTDRNALHVRKGQLLGRGDRLARVLIPRGLGQKRRDLPRELVLRFVTATRRGFRRRLLATTLLDAATFPASEIAALYADRWEAELAYREMKIHQADKRVNVTFRSHTPTRVLQEFYALLIAYNCIRALMADAARLVGAKPTQLSFTNCLERIRAALTGVGSALHELLLVDLSLCRLQRRRPGRRYERAVKIKMSNYPRTRRRRGTHRTCLWRQVPC
jgi:hypothetical protein